MADAAHSTAARKLRGISPDMDARLAEIERRGTERARTRMLQDRSEFESLHRDWLANRARLEGPEDHFEEDEIETMERRDAALAMRLATTPAPVPSSLKAKMEVVEHYMAGGPYSDNRMLPLFAGLRADIARFVTLD